MAISPLAGKPAPRAMLVDLARLEQKYYERKPDVGNPDERVSFGTSGHRGSSLRGSFTEAHILAITQAICDYRRSQGIDGLLYMGKDTHALSRPAERTALEVLAANEVNAVIQRDDGVTPTPVISRAILVENRDRRAHLADGIVITPSHNPPGDGGFKYNPPAGGPADTDATGWIQHRANALLADLRQVRRMPYRRARTAATVHEHDYLGRYVDDLPGVVDLDAIRASGVRMGVDPLGGSSLAYWHRIAQRPSWPREAAVGKTVVTSSMIDRVAGGLGRPLVEVPVGFKWFVEGLLSGTFGFGGEESAGASFLRQDGTAWTTDKDGLI